MYAPCAMSRTQGTHLAAIIAVLIAHNPVHVNDISGERYHQIITAKKNVCVWVCMCVHNSLQSLWAIY